MQNYRKAPSLQNVLPAPLMQSLKKQKYWAFKVLVLIRVLHSAVIRYLHSFLFFRRRTLKNQKHQSFDWLLTGACKHVKFKQLVVVLRLYEGTCVVIGSNQSIYKSQPELHSKTNSDASILLSMTLNFTPSRRWPVLVWHIETNIQLGNEKCTCQAPL